MTTLNTLREERAKKAMEMRGLADTAKAANRDLDEGERNRFDVLDGELSKLEARIKVEEKLAHYERFEERGESVQHPEMRNMVASYSAAKAISEAMNGRLTGIEAEMHAELSRGRGETRGIMMPTEVFLESRALTTTTPAGLPGGNLIGTDLAPITDRRRAALLIEKMGSTVLRGLTGNLDLPRMAQSGSARWIAEHTNATRSDAGFSKTSMTPKTVTAEYEISRRMLLQSQVALEPLLRADLGFLLSQALDAAAIRGGGANEPTGILENADVVQMANAVLSSDLTADLIAALEADDVTGTTAFLTNPRVMSVVRKMKDGDGHTFSLAEFFHGKTVEATNQVPFTTAAAAPAPEKYPLIYGEWASLYLGYWSGIDLLVNPYHADVASKGGVLLHAFLDADVAVRHPEGFVWAEID
ncbi:MAG: phage major capsid protein [Paracoccus sp. (in: a-proteobacteria)]